MKISYNPDLTFILEQVSAARQRQIEEHLGSISQVPTPDPSVFEVRALYDEVSISTDYLDILHALPLHSHTFMEIVYYASGSGIDYLIDTHRYRLQKGDIVFVPPGVCHCVLRSSSSAEPCIRYLLVLRKRFFESNSGIFPEEMSSQEDPYLLRTAGTDKEYLGKLFDLCAQEAKIQDYRWRDMLQGFVLILIAQIGRACRDEAPMTVREEKRGLFEKILSYVDDHLSDRITLSDTARSLYTSERTINRVFQQNMGISFYRYVTQRRLEMAKDLIMEGNSMESVCTAVGFSDYPSFYRAFRKRYDLSPRQMRRLNQQ